MVRSALFSASALLSGVVATVSPVRAEDARDWVFGPSVPFGIGSAHQESGAGYPTLDGWKNFCARGPYAKDCVPTGTPDSHVVMYYERYKELKAALAYSASCEYASDESVYGQSDFWTRPFIFKGCKADCEDAALMARAYLMERGWPTSALLVTYVIPRKKESPTDPDHAVLTVRTTQGDQILNWAEILTADKANEKFAFVSRQSRSDPNIWVMLNPVPTMEKHLPLSKDLPELATINLDWSAPKWESLIQGSRLVLEAEVER